MHPYVYCNIIHSGQDKETTEVFFNRRSDKEDVVCIHYGILLSHKKNKIPPLATTLIDPENITLSEISQSEKAKNHTMSLICEV